MNSTPRNESAYDYSALVLITYTTSPEATARGYEAWLRTEDNPTFNRTPGIVHYANWKVAEAHPGGLPFTHFDLVGITGLDALEQVWFDPMLDSFRAGWVRKWGYGSVPARPENRYASLAARQGGRRGAHSRFLQIIGERHAASESSAMHDGFESWTFIESLRKHWAAGRASEGEPWRQPIAAFNPLGLARLHLQYVAAPSAIGASDTTRGDTMEFYGECIAAPDRAALT